MKVTVLKCPGCGANLESNRTICLHCGTTVRLTEDHRNFIGTGTECPQCNAINQIGDGHCGNCGENLIVICPVPNCRTENSVWRKFCRKCGRDIIGFHIEMLENDQAKYREKIKYHSFEIDRIQKQLPISKRREKIVQIYIGLIGGLISLGFWGTKYRWVGIISTMIVIGFIAFCYHSSETDNLLNSLSLHIEDFERFQERYEINELKLTRIKSRE